MRPSSNMSWPAGSMPQNQAAFLYQPESSLGNEFAVLSDFLESLDERSFFNPPPTTVAPSLMTSAPFMTPSDPSPRTNSDSFTTSPETTTMSNPSPPSTHPPVQVKEEAVPIVLPAATKTEQFFLTAADQKSGSRNERLNEVIRSKFEAGLLKPYNYVKGYARLSRWMDSK